MSASDNSDQVEFWSASAGQRWAARQAELDILMQPVLDGMLARAELAPGLRVLDIGCGAGAGCLAAAEAVGDAGAVLGVDVSAPLLDLAWQRAAALPHVAFHHGDATTLALSPPYDRLISRFGVMFFADPVLSFTRMAAQLSPGAKLSFAAWGQIPENPFFTLPARAARATIGAMPKSDPDGPGPFAFRDPERVVSILAEAGFVDIACKVTRLDLPPAGTVDDLAQQMCDIGPASGAINHFEAGPAQVAELRQTIAEALRPYAKDGPLRLPAEINFVTATKP
ncbi:methyltransferase domain-containing protein [Sulfitobacter faviae]|uniref:Methyltransferase domain-containing protein n=1 Tax=Sulfitobacter faviae TaxID=1775881 RepID=A0ABZ0UY18_9RHOB|nr:methyltransferase domain-containing protein [Sulfitobacter faviae]WPZ20531.1 methyltransferase domain-containing protein [Sulfitobacter faviae]